MFLKIIVGYDGTPSADDALVLAQRLGTPGRTHLTLAGVHPPGRPERVHDALENGLTRLDAGWEATSAPIPAESPARGLTELAEDVEADLVVVGSTHRGRLGRVVPGSTAQRLLHGSPCAVGIAPRHGRPAQDPITWVGVAVNRSPEAAEALSVAYALAAERDAGVNVYTVIEVPPGEEALAGPGTPAREAAERLLDAAAARAPEGVHARIEALAGLAAETIVKRAAGVVDVLVAGSRGYGPLRRVLLGSVSGGLLREAPFPVVIVPRAAVAERARHVPRAQA